MPDPSPCRGSTQAVPCRRCGCCSAQQPALARFGALLAALLFTAVDQDL